MAIPDRDTRYTYDDYLLFPDDGLRHELIGGEHYVSAAPFPDHQIVAGNLHRLISPHVYELRLGRLLFSPVDLVLSDEDVVQPDLVFFSRDRLSQIDRGRGLFGPPDLVVEILSKSTRHVDSKVKLALYERSGVLEYWLVDPLQKTVQVYRLSSGLYQFAAELSEEAGDLLETPLLPGLSIPVVQIFE